MKVDVLKGVLLKKPTIAILRSLISGWFSRCDHILGRKVETELAEIVEVGAVYMNELLALQSPELIHSHDRSEEHLILLLRVLAIYRYTLGASIIYSKFELRSVLVWILQLPERLSLRNGVTALELYAVVLNNRPLTIVLAGCTYFFSTHSMFLTLISLSDFYYSANLYAFPLYYYSFSSLLLPTFGFYSVALGGATFSYFTYFLGDIVWGSFTSSLFSYFFGGAFSYFLGGAVSSFLTGTCCYFFSCYFFSSFYYLFYYFLLTSFLGYSTLIGFCSGYSGGSVEALDS